MTAKATMKVRNGRPNAFFAATAADGSCDQNPISRYDAKPTPSQPT